MSFRTILTSIRQFFGFVAQVEQRVSGLLLLLGGLTAMIGWLIASLNPYPLASTWLPSVWAVIIGSLVLVLGMLGLYVQHILRAGLLGWYGVIILFFGTVLMTAGACAIDVFVLPWMFKLISQIPGLSGQTQSVLNSAIQHVNNASATAINGCNQIFGYFGIHCGSTSDPRATLKTVDGVTLVNELLAKLGLPTLNSLGFWGLFFLSGAPLALGCLLLSLTFLWTGLRPRSALFICMLCTCLNVPGQFFFHLTFPGLLCGILFFLSVAWLGFTLCLPDARMRIVGNGS